ncbi:hypothetical protein O3M35_010912 [Rhynocoris fuscipes]|uniref:Cytochrome b5 heme-binding domain-containing protein n=1 Tax=Rhynocoris fuscipes TaxID=488301 RepID=A0AAW1D8E9_9HEMI
MEQEPNLEIFSEEKKLGWESHISTNDDDLISSERLFTKDELSKYKGENGKIYLSIIGHVFDVTKGKRFYGPGESYHGFAGRDASKAFITGDFTKKGLIDDLADLTLSDLRSLRDWLDRYKKDYIYKGKLIGRFYDRNGNPTAYLREIESKFFEADEIAKQNEDYNIKYPPCNVEWTQEKGSRVWCSNKSGGIKRNWVGVPRKLFLPGWSDYRCACIQPDDKELFDQGKLKLYGNCNPHSESCFVDE